MAESDFILKFTEKARKYCVYQERCHSELRSKLLLWGVRGKGLEEIISKMIEEGFLNEERFAIAYAGGKFRIKSWGIQKIANELRKKNVSDYCINKALKQLDTKDYKKSLIKLIEKKEKILKEENPFKRKNKLASFVIGKGYEPEYVWDILNDK